MRQVVLGGVFLSLFSLFSLGGCAVSEKQLVERNELKYAVVSQPEYQACEFAVDDVYRCIVQLQVSSNQPTYQQWSKLNGLMAESLSAMTNGDYTHCVTRAAAVHAYIQKQHLTA